MKRLLAALVFLNVAVYAYLHLIAVPPPPLPAPASPRPLRLAGEAPAKVAPGPPACRSVGPLKDADVAHRVADWLGAAHMTATERSLEVDAPPSYWVITTRRSPALAARLAQQLKAAGVGDVEVVPPTSGDGETRVSLGVYADRARAERRVLDLKGYALGPTILEQPHRVTQWWLDVASVGEGAAIDVAALVRDVPAAAGATLGPCVLSLPPADNPGEGPPAPSAPAAAPKPAAGTA